ncbi:LOW QUALITY PROTEIN: zf-CCHC domain-containing protein/UBN2 domain-containing protein [Cephalotus follicularis]|uniref:Zf-CCHC domain-containing protein/UBN2 domain-containing protein n=1 Tax=Cephalotus follicularis TaxID=3775 RepID=A0A1Q3C2G6_CEPFO|nr:LOW QUALITY PROTEIN: zf-CCHC domain-containing protein/UBN2 domain-containing protein [Cephalotus follicularis]
MFTHFTTIVNSLKNLGKYYSNQELVRRILRCLPRSWTPKVTPIEEAKDLSTPPLEQLLGLLMTHETTMKNHEYVEVKKKKTIALRASKGESESDEDGDMAFITSQFKNKREEPTCYECKKPGHFKNMCPNLKKKKNSTKSKKKKAFVATWDDIDPSSSKKESDEEVANIAVMAIEEEDEDEVNFTFDELQNDYENLFNEYKNVCIKNKSLKKDVCSIKNSYYMNEIDVLNVSSKLSIDFKEEYDKLKLEIGALKKTFSKFSNSTDKFDNLLGLQMCVFDKVGLGYEEMNSVKHFNNFFVNKNEPKNVCNYCCNNRNFNPCTPYS